MSCRSKMWPSCTLSRSWSSFCRCEMNT
jgi:hypothetical protein